jgi:hypothetical protein
MSIVVLRTFNEPSVQAAASGHSTVSRLTVSHSIAGHSTEGQLTEGRFDREPFDPTDRPNRVSDVS